MVAEHIVVTIVYADLNCEFELSVTVKAGASIAAVMSQTACIDRVPEPIRGDLSFAIYGRRVSADYILSSGERIELLRPLMVDPKEARRRRARRC